MSKITGPILSVDDTAEFIAVELIGRMAPGASGPDYDEAVGAMTAYWRNLITDPTAKQDGNDAMAALSKLVGVDASVQVESPKKKRRFFR